MLEGVIVFIIGYICGKYTDKVIEISKRLYNKYFGKKEEEIINE